MLDGAAQTAAVCCGIGRRVRLFRFGGLVCSNITYKQADIGISLANNITAEDTVYNTNHKKHCYNEHNTHILYSTKMQGALLEKLMN